jgi:hypothetical protein
MTLDRDKRRQAFAFRQRVGFRQLPGKAI